MYVNREACLLRESTSNHNSTPTATTVREPGQGIGVTMVARPTASKRWRLDRKHGRRRPAAGVTTPEQQRQRPVQQEKAATRHGHSRRRYVNDVRPTTSPSHSTPLDSTATPWTAVRQLVRHTPSDSTLRQLQRRLLWLLSFATELSQLSYSSSVSVTLCLGYSR